MTRVFLMGAGGAECSVKSSLFYALNLPCGSSSGTWPYRACVGVTPMMRRMIYNKLFRFLSFSRKEGELIFVVDILKSTCLNFISCFFRRFHVYTHHSYPL